MFELCFGKIFIQAPVWSGLPADRNDDVHHDGYGTMWSMTPMGYASNA